MKHLNRIAAAVAFIATTFLFSACGGESFTDPRDGQKYKTVKIGNQVWMAENLKYKGGAKLVSETGAYYTWDSALVACPDGWRLPSKEELESAIADTNIKSSWSSTEKTDFSLRAYEKDEDELTTAAKTDGRHVLCIQGDREKQHRIQEVNGYKVVRIGNQIWMADNLTIKTPNSICYLDDESECSSGRFYPFSEAINVCPEGWHLPSKSEAAKFINKLIKENGRIKTTHGYYVSKDEKFEDFWGDAVLWTSTYGFVMRDREHFNPEIWEGRVFIKSENWKLAVRCIADTEEKKEE